MRHKTQADIVNQANAEEKVALGGQETHKVVVPGIKTLHQQSAEEIAIVLTNVLRSAPNITKLEWVIGEYIQLTSAEPDL